MTSNSEDEVRDLRAKNTELAKEVQSLKILVAQKDREKLELTKEINELRLKISRLRSSGEALALKMDSGLQEASKEALSLLVQASGAVLRTRELSKQYMQERKELELTSPRWSHIGQNNPSGKKVNEVPPLLLGGQSIQPVVSLSRTMLSNRSINRSPNQNSGVTHRALPMHLLQDAYIPLTRIDAAEFQSNSLDEDEHAAENENSADDLGLDESIEQPVETEDAQNLLFNDLDESRGLEAVIEESMETEDEGESPLRQSSQNLTDNPLEGPSWLLDMASPSENANGGGLTLEADSTTPCFTPSEQMREDPPEPAPAHTQAEGSTGRMFESLAFTPTVRRRKRASSPPAPAFSPRPKKSHAQEDNSIKILKVVVAKMRLSDDPGASGDPAPSTHKSPRPNQGSPRTAQGRPTSRRPTVDSPQRKDGYRPRFDAPSPNGSTDAGVIVCESQSHGSLAGAGAGRRSRRDSCGRGLGSREPSRSGSRHDSDSDGADSDTRARRNRKQVSYKEKPLNRKLRR